MLNIPGFAKMSKEQLEAATCGLGPVLISAGPGSGKTFTITHRILHLILEKGCSPQEIFVITFTKDAALSMNRRYQEILQEQKGDTAELRAVHFGTFHSFYYQIIRSHPKYRNYSLLNASGRSGILFRVLKNMGKETLHGKELERCLAEISYYKNTGKASEGQGEDFIRLVQAFDKEKEREKVLDFDDMLTLCHEILREDISFRESWQKRIGYLLVDEFQDTNEVQYETMKLLLKSPYNVCVVGDDDQAIYGFRGSRPGIMKQFLEDYPKAEVHYLGTNYRCGEQIVELSAKLIGKNSQRMLKELSSTEQGDKGEVFVNGAESYGKMIQECIKELQEKEEQGLSESAVLFRTNMRMNLFLVELIKNKIPFQTKERISSIYEHFVVKDILDYLRAAAGCRERSLFLRILNKPRTHIGREAFFEETVDLEKVISFYGKDGIGNNSAMKDALRVKTGLENLKKLKLSLGIEFILHYFGYDTYLRNKSGGDMALYEEWLGILQWLKEDSKSFRDLKEWERFQQEFISKAQRQVKEECRKGVNVMTLHGCKGLEFQTVYIMYVNEGNIPNVKRGEVLSREALEEERRLFYVGMTRAKKTLDIRYVNQTKDSPRSPSRFIKDMQD